MRAFSMFISLYWYKKIWRFPFLDLYLKLKDLMRASNLDGVVEGALRLLVGFV